MRKHCLLIEDRTEDALSVKKHLSAYEGLGLHWVMDGEEAVTYLQKSDGFKDAPSPDLILLDLKLPGMDGFKFLEWLNSDRLNRTTPVIVLTVSGLPDDMRRAEKLGVKSYLTKPANWKRLQDEVSALIASAEFTGFDEETALRVMRAGKPKRRTIKCVLKLFGGRQVTVTASATHEEEEAPFKYNGDISLFRPFAEKGTLGFFKWYLEAIAANIGADVEFFEEED